MANSMNKAWEEALELHKVGEPVHLPALWAEVLNVSRSEARRVIAQGGQFIDGKRDDRMDVPRSELDGALVNLGSRHVVEAKQAEDRTTKELLKQGARAQAEEDAQLAEADMAAGYETLT